MQASSCSAALPAVSLSAGDCPDVSSSHASWWKVWQFDPVIILTVGGRCLGLAAGLVGSVVTARYLQPAGRGEYFLALTTAQLIAQFGSLGLQSGNTYFVARDRGLFSGLLANSVWISFFGAPIMGVALLIASLWGATGATTATTGWFAVALAPLFVFNLLGNGLFVGLNQMKTFSLLQPMSAVVVLPLILVAAMLHAGPSGFLVASLAGWTLTIAIMLVLLFRQSTGATRFRPDILLTTCSYSTKVYLATLAGFIVLRMNVFILHAVAGAEQVGYYSIASQIADTLAILPQSIATVLFPRLVASRAGRFKATMRDAGRTALLLFAMCAIAWACATPAIHLAFGPRFAPAVPVLRAMLPGVFLLGVMSVVSQYLAASGFPVSVVVCWLASVVLGGGVGYGLIARSGAVGASEALSVTYAALLMALLFLSWRAARLDALGRRRRDDKLGVEWNTH
jgi:enterobacterial common antigen flippase